MKNELIRDKNPLDPPQRCYEKTSYGNGCVYPTCLYFDVLKKKCELNACVKLTVKKELQ